MKPTGCGEGKSTDFPGWDLIHMHFYSQANINIPYFKTALSDKLVAQVKDWELEVEYIAQLLQGYPDQAMLLSRYSFPCTSYAITQ